MYSLNLHHRRIDKSFRARFTFLGSQNAFGKRKKKEKKNQRKGKEISSKAHQRNTVSSINFNRSGSTAQF